MRNSSFFIILIKQRLDLAHVHHHALEVFIKKDFIISKTVKD